MLAEEAVVGADSGVIKRRAPWQKRLHVLRVAIRTIGPAGAPAQWRGSEAPRAAQGAEISVQHPKDAGAADHFEATRFWEPGWLAAACHPCSDDTGMSERVSEAVAGNQE